MPVLQAKILVHSLPRHLFIVARFTTSAYGTTVLWSSLAHSHCFYGFMNLKVLEKGKLGA